MKTLTLPLKKNWFDLIKAGVKKCCKLEDGKFVCYSCSEGNFKGLKAKGLTKWH